MSINKALSHIAVIQTNATNVMGTNLVTIKMLITQAIKDGARLVILPSQFSYVPEQDDELVNAKESSQSQRVQMFLSKLAAELKVWIVGGTIPMDVDVTDKAALAVIVWSDCGEAVARYDKIHLGNFDLGGISPISEAAYIVPGDATVVVETPVGKVGLAVDFDLYFPDHFQSLRQQGAEIIALPSLFYNRLGLAHWKSLLRARAIETQCYVAAANQFGQLPNTRLMYGHSMIVGPWGSVLGCKETAAGFVTASVDLGRLAFLRHEIVLA